MYETQRGLKDEIQQRAQMKLGAQLHISVFLYLA